MIQVYSSLFSPLHGYELAEYLLCQCLLGIQMCPWAKWHKTLTKKLQTTTLLSLQLALPPVPIPVSKFTAFQLTADLGGRVPVTFQKRNSTTQKQASKYRMMRCLLRGKKWKWEVAWEWELVSTSPWWCTVNICGGERFEEDFLGGGRSSALHHTAMHFPAVYISETPHTLQHIIAACKSNSFLCPI